MKVETQTEKGSNPKIILSSHDKHLLVKFVLRLDHLENMTHIKEKVLGLLVKELEEKQVKQQHKII